MERRFMSRSRLMSAAAVVMIGVISLGLAACGGGGSSSTEDKEGTTSASSSDVEGLKVGYFISKPTNAYIGASIEGAKIKAADYGIDLTIVESSFDPGQQIEQMQQAMQRDSFDYWMAALNSGVEECGIVKSAIAADIPVFLVGGRACGGEDIGALGFVGVQGPEAYEEWFDYILSENEPQEMAVLTGPAGVDITEYAEEELEKAQKKYPGFDVVSVENTDYTTGNAYQVTQDLLQAHPDLGIVASNYSGMTNGVIQAVKAAGKIGKVKIYDLLGDKYMAKAIKNGEVTATMPGVPRTETEYAIESIVHATEGKQVAKEYSPLVNLKIKDGPFVTKTNVDEFEPEY